jgi:uncharacterized protein (UPF0297 family)
MSSDGSFFPQTGNKKKGNEQFHKEKRIDSGRRGLCRGTRFSGGPRRHNPLGPNKGNGFRWSLYQSEVEGSMDETMKFDLRGEEQEVAPKEVLLLVYEALKEKGYNPINQIVGYLLSGDPAYIPRHNNARAMIRKVERDELMEELVRFYLQSQK